jgi:hypothetical protein
VIYITKFPCQTADLIDMLTLLLLFAFQVASAREMACVGSIQEMKVPEDVYIAGVSDEGTSTIASPGQVIYLNGPGISALKAGTVYRVIRPEGRVRDPKTSLRVGTYYKDIGTIVIDSVETKSAAARVMTTCNGMMVKGDVVVPNTPRSAVEFSGDKSNALTSVKGGLTSSILFAKDDVKEMAAGTFCFIPLGRRDGVKPGDRFVVFRSYPSYNPQDMNVLGISADSTYAPARSRMYRYKQESALRGRTLPPKILGDIVIVEAEEGVATGMIINSLSEIQPGDSVVKK